MLGQKIFFLACYLVFCSSLHSQTGLETEKPIPRVSLDNLIQGRLYSPVYPLIRGTQFLNDSWTSGSVVLLEKEYRDIPFVYDIFLDELIFLHKRENYFQYIQLNKEQISQFQLGTRFFINLNYSSYPDSTLRSGYYEVLFEGKVSLLAKRQMVTKIDDSIEYFDRNDRWYLILGDKSFRVRNKKTFLSAVDDAYQKELATFIKKQGIRLSRAGDLEWLGLVIQLNKIMGVTNDE